MMISILMEGKMKPNFLKAGFVPINSLNLSINCQCVHKFFAFEV